jgi:hypothetical protein
MSDYSIYPKAIDGYAQIPLAVDKKSPINAESVNRLRSGIINIEKAIGVAPEFSEEFGSFPDFASRLDSIESKYVTSTSTSLTALYKEDNVIQLDEKPLALKAPNGSHIGFGLADENFIIGSSTGIELEANGSLPGEGGVPSWPNSIIINKSTSVPFPVITEFNATLSSYLSLGGALAESDFAVVKIENADSDSGGGVVALLAGMNSNSNNVTDPTSLIMSCIETQKPQSEGGNIMIEAGGVNDDLSSAGSVSFRSGEHRGITPDPGEPGHKVKGGFSEMHLSGPSWHQHGQAPATFHSSSIRLLGGREGANEEDPRFPRGGQISCYGAEPWAGGEIRIEGGAGIDDEAQNQPEIEGGQVYIEGGAGHRGGDVSIASGESLDEGEDASNVYIRTPSSAGTIYAIGSVELGGHTTLFGGLSSPIKTWSSENDNDSYSLTKYDFTVLVNINHDNVTIHLPDAGSCPGRLYNIKKVDAVKTATIRDAGNAKIDGCDEKFLQNEYDMLALQSDGDNWFIIGSNF